MTSLPSDQNLRILLVRPGSPAEAAGVRRGDRLRGINGHRIHDPIDYRFYQSEARVDLELQRGDRLLRPSLTKDMDEDLGLELEEAAYRTCRNRCLFCFVRQMPPGMRPTLYVKDDDFRLSFLHGNYITLTNLEESDYERIFAQRLSPLYVSVHATDPTTRARILGNPGAPPVLPAMERLLSRGIELHAQIVLCPGINDGAVLDRTIGDLLRLPPGLGSVAVVPVGLTRHRRGLPHIRGVDAGAARALLDQLEQLRRNSATLRKGPWLFPSDEFYLLAGRSFPPAHTYGDFPQLENGVGMTARFLREVEEALPSLPRNPGGRPHLIGTGTLALPVLRSLVTRLEHRTGRPARVVPIANTFFGDSVTVAGLITGKDLLTALSGLPGSGPITLPDSMLDAGNLRFLDDMTPREAQEASGRRLRFVTPDAQGLLSLFR